MNILVIGASGLVGYNCYVFLKRQDINVLGTHRHFPTSFTQKFDTIVLGDEENNILNSFKPNVIIHCAALTNVDECETNVEKSYSQTVISVKNVIRIATKYNSKVVYISTDYVFNGINGPYKETDDVDPINVYGEHKLLSEILIREHCSNNLIVRVTNVYGDEIRGKNFVSRLLSTPNDVKKLKLPIDQFATPINAADIAKAIYHLIIDNKFGIYHLASTDYCNRYQLANMIIDTQKYHKWQFEPVKTLELNQVARRPLMGGLLAFKFVNEYPYFRFTNVSEYILKNNLK